MIQNTTRQENSKVNMGFAWLLFLIFPIISLIFAVKNYPIKKYRIFIYGFFLFYGFTFVPIPKSDGSRHKEHFEAIRDYTFSDYCQDISDVVTGKSDNTDFYILTINYVSNFISKDTKIFFLIVASIYYFVFLRLIATIWNLVLKKETKYFISFFLGCCFIDNLSAGVDGIRFPLAFMVFCLGALNLLITNKKKHLFIAALSLLIHFAFAYSLPFLVVIYLFRFSIKTWVLYFLIALVLSLSFLFLTFIQSNLGSLGSTAETKFAGYTAEGFLEGRADVKQSWNWYVVFNLYSTYVFSVLSLLLIKLKFFKLKFDALSNRLFVFSFVMLIHAILSGSVVDTISNRYNILFKLFQLIFLFYLSSINKGNKLMIFLNYVYVPIVIINILIKTRADLYTVNVLIFFGNFILSFFINEPISIQDYLLN